NLAVRNKRPDLEITAKGWLAGASGADGDPVAGSRKFDEAAALARDLGIKLPPELVSLHGLFLYWAGRVEDALERSRRGIEAVRQANDVSALMFSLPHLGMSLAAGGRYDEAAAVFDEAHRTGREYRIDGVLGRALWMLLGSGLDLFDFAGAGALSNEAREFGLTGPFLPAVTSATLDLLFNFVRRGDIGRADGWIDTVAASLEPVAGFHRWLWAGRLAQVRAELAAAKGQWDEALRGSDEAIRQAQASQRVKYQALGLEVRAP